MSESGLTQPRRVADAWDREYRHGRYVQEEPLSFANDIISAAERRWLLGRAGLYIGCGNGRNYIPLVTAGLDLTGIDVSKEAILQLTSRMPARANHLVHGDITVLPPDTKYGVVVAIQVFQHGDRLTCHTHIRRAQRLVADGGIMAVRVNAVQTDIVVKHDVVEPLGTGLTVRYREGPKSGLLVHFFEREELQSLFEDTFEVDQPLRLDSILRESPGAGQWSQWEGIWARTPS